MKKIWFTMLALVVSMHVFAQSQTDAYYKTHPAWIQMMDKEHVQYDEAIKAFNLYWLDKEKPSGEHALFSAKDPEKATTVQSIQKKKNAQLPAVTYAIEYKKFMHWQQKVLSYLNEDGTVMNAQERIENWKKQLENRK